MKKIDLSQPTSVFSEGIARRTRHLTARLLDFGTGGPVVLDSDQKTGRVSVRFPGHDDKEILDLLAIRSGVTAALEEGSAVFYLSPHIPFEDLDYVWGCLFELL